MNAPLTFRRAERKRARLRIAISGPSGAGKTEGALLIAKGLGGRTALADTERNSAELYADRYDFDVLDMGPPYAPENFIAAIRAAEAAGYDTLIIDSATHEWNGSGGVLEIVDQLSKVKDNRAAWKEMTPRHRKFLDAMLQSTCHIIMTMRSKVAYVEEKDDRGRTKMKKAGMAPEQRDGIEYEFTTVLDITVDGHIAAASKDRTNLFSDPHVITVETGKRLLNWLNSGAAPTLQPDEKTAHSSSIEAAPNLDELKLAFGRGYTQAKRVGDEQAMADFKAAYDKRKGELEAVEAARLRPGAGAALPVESPGKSDQLSPDDGPDPHAADDEEAAQEAREREGDPPAFDEARARAGGEG